MKDQYDRQKENQKFQKELLGYLINDENLYIRAIDIIRPEMFTNFNRQIFDAYTALIQESKKPDAFSISSQGNLDLEKVIDVATAYSGVDVDIDSLLYELYQFMARDKYMRIATFISNQVTAGTESELIKDFVIEEITKLEFGNSSKVITMKQGVESLYKIIENNRKSISITGCPTGLRVIDKHMGGLQPGDLIILAGEVSHGKTSLALSMLYNSAVIYNEKCGIISHEMTSDQLTARLASISTKISSKHILTGKMSDEEISLFSNKVQSLMDSNIYIQDYIKRELVETISSIRLMVLQHGIKYIVVENAGNINVKGKNEDEARTAEISKSLKSLALELKITIILISHLSRAKDGKKAQPELSRLRHSGQLEADADVVMFIYRPELHGYDTFREADHDDIDDSTEDRCKVYIAKGRNYGLVNSFPDFDTSTTYVSDHNSYDSQEYKLSPNNQFIEEDVPY